jgi:hypothetical protein
MALQNRCRSQFEGWNVHHFLGEYPRDGETRISIWVKKQRQEGGLVAQGKQRGTHRKKRERKPLPGMMIHQDGSRHEEQHWGQTTINFLSIHPSIPPHSEQVPRFRFVLPDWTPSLPAHGLSPQGRRDLFRKAARAESASLG